MYAAKPCLLSSSSLSLSFAEVTEGGGERMKIRAMCAREGVRVLRRSMRERVVGRCVGWRESGVRRVVCRVGG